MQKTKVEKRTKNNRHCLTLKQKLSCVCACAKQNKSARALNAAARELIILWKVVQ